MVNIAVAGCGRRGSEYVRVFDELDGARVTHVYDPAATASEKISTRFPSVRPAASLGEILRSADVDAVVVAAPAPVHHELGMECLSSGKHVLVEAPLAMTDIAAAGMIDLSIERSKVLMPAQTMTYDPGVRTVKDQMGLASFGKTCYLNARRTETGPLLKDMSALWDLAVHDVSVFGYLLGDSPVWVSATGARLSRNGSEDAVFMTLGYPDGVTGNIHVSRADPCRARHLTVVGSRRSAAFDGLAAFDRVKVYDNAGGHEYPSEGSACGIRGASVTAPKVDGTEPLKLRSAHFVECVREGRAATADAINGLNVVCVMLAAQESLKTNGVPVEVRSLLHNLC